MAASDPTYTKHKETSRRNVEREVTQKRGIMSEKSQLRAMQRANGAVLSLRRERRVEKRRDMLIAFPQIHTTSQMRMESY